MSRGRADDRIREAVDAGLAAVAEGMGLDPSPRSLAPAIEEAARRVVTVMSLRASAHGYPSDPAMDGAPWAFRLPKGVRLAEIVSPGGHIRLDHLRQRADNPPGETGLPRLMAAVGAFVPVKGQAPIAPLQLYRSLSRLSEGEQRHALQYAASLIVDSRGITGSIRHAPPELFDALPPLELTYTPASGEPVTSRLIIRVAAGFDWTGFHPKAIGHDHAGVNVVALLTFDGPAPEGWSREDREGFWSEWCERFPLNRRDLPSPPDTTGADSAAMVGEADRPAFYQDFGTARMDRGVSQTLDALQWFPNTAHAAPWIDAVLADELEKAIDLLGGEEAARNAVDAYDEWMSRPPKIEGEEEGEEPSEPPLTVRGGELVLSSRAALSMREELSLRGGYREIDKGGREWFVRGHYGKKDKGGKRPIIETMLRVDGASARVLSPEGSRQARDAIEKSREENRELLIPETPPEAIDAAERLTQEIDDALTLLPYIAMLPEIYGTTKLRVPVLVLKNVLRISAKERRGTARVEDAIAMLGRFEIKTRNLGGSGGSNHAIQYRPVHDPGKVSGITRAGGDSDIEFSVGEKFLGVLRDVFTARSGEDGVLDASETAKLPAGQYDTVPTGLPMVRAAFEWGPRQVAIRKWLDRQETMLKDAARKTFPGRPGREDVRLITDEDARDCRVYTDEFCPLLPEGKRYHAALGHFPPSGKGKPYKKKNGQDSDTGAVRRRTAPENGWRIGGSGKDGPAPDDGEGFVGLIGLSVRGIRSGRRRRVIYNEALDALREIVVEFFGGVIAGIPAAGDRWLSLEEIEALPDADFHRVRLYPFLPEDWREREIAGWEDQMLARYTTGDEPHAWRAARTRGEAEQSKNKMRGRAIDGRSLKARRKELGLSQEKAAKLLGVKRAMYGHWETGEKGIAEDRLPDVQAFMDGRLLPEQDASSGAA